MKSGQATRARDFECQVIVRGAERPLPGLEVQGEERSLGRGTQVSRAARGALRSRLGLAWSG